MKNIIPLIILISILVFNACDKPLAKPDNLIDKDEFIQIMTQTLMYKNVRQKDVKSGKIDLIKEEAYILQSRGLTWEDFKESYAYYMSDEKMNREIYEKIERNLEMMAPNYAEEKLEDKLEPADSIKKPKQKIFISDSVSKRPMPKPVIK